jgi:septation ring formation regulator EzrA
MERNEANRQTINEIINLVESSQCDIIHIRDQLEETNTQLEHALQRLEELLVTQDQTDPPVTLQAHAVAQHPEAQVIEVCARTSRSTKPKAKPTKKGERLAEARTRAREWAESLPQKRK